MLLKHLRPCKAWRAASPHKPSAIESLVCDRRGGVMVVFAVSLPVLFGAVGLAIDYGNATRVRVSLQVVADQAALTAARELRLGNSNDTIVSQVASNFARASLPASQSTIDVSSSISSDRTSLTVTIVKAVDTVFPQQLGLPFASVRVNARARVLGGAPLCLLALDTAAPTGLSVSLSSNITANACAVYSNSKSATSLAASDTSRVNATSACSGGGVKGTSSNFNPMPQTDCPALPDPLAGRTPPTVGAGCDYNNLVILGGSRSLLPGTYCGGLNISLSAKVTLAAGVYVIKDGPLTVTFGASLTGSGVGFFLTGNASLLAFLPGSTIDLTAPVSGPMAGVLFWENPATANAVTPHIIFSDHAHNLLGTIYIPGGNLSIGSPNAVADQSAYTIIVAKTVIMAASPNLVLNSNYNATLVPVPAGLGNKTSNVALDR